MTSRGNSFSKNSRGNLIEACTCIRLSAESMGEYVLRFSTKQGLQHKVRDTDQLKPQQI